MDLYLKKRKVVTVRKQKKLSYFIAYRLDIGIIVVELSVMCRKRSFL